MLKCIRALLMASCLLWAATPSWAVVTGTLTISSQSHTVGQSSTNSVVDMNWTGLTAGNGVMTYKYVVDSYSTLTTADFQTEFNAAATTTLLHADLGSSTKVTLSALPDGTYYFHLQAFDADGLPNGTSPLNSGAPYTFGKIVLDSAPTLAATSISPANGAHTTANTVTITGSKFMAGATVDLVDGTRVVALTGVNIASSTSISATIPKGTPPRVDSNGTVIAYDLKVTNPSPWKQKVTATKSFTVTNQKPVANPGSKQTVTITGGSATLNLDGSASSDPDTGDTIQSYSWTATAVVTNGGVAKNATFSGVKPTGVVVTKAGTYTFSLVVSDGYSNSSAVTVDYSVSVSGSNTAPTADAGSSQVVLPGATVTLDGSKSSDPDGNALTYSWDFYSMAAGVTTKPTISVLTGNDYSKVKFTAPTVSGVYKIALLVTDTPATGLTALTSPYSYTTVTVNYAPTANAGKDIYGAVNHAVTLDGSASLVDNNGSTDEYTSQTLSYTWDLYSQPTSGGVAARLSTTTAKPSFTPLVVGDYVFKLTVNDGFVSSSNSSKVTVHVINGFTITHKYKIGLNLVPFPFVNTGYAKASDFVKALKAVNTGMVISQMFGLVNGNFTNLYDGSAITDFTLVPGDAYIVQVSGATGTLSLTGLPPTTVSLAKGLNLIAVPTSEQSAGVIKASDFATNRLQTGNLVQMFYWDTTVTPSTFSNLYDGSAVTDFSLPYETNGFVLMLNNTDTYTPQ